MNPNEIRTTLSPVLGEDIARGFAGVSAQHKAGTAGTVSVPSWVLVKVGEKLVELVRGRPL